MRLTDIPFEETRHVEPPAPPVSDLLAGGEARAAALRYWVIDGMVGASRVGLHATFRLLPLDWGSGLGAGLGPVFRRLNRRTLASARMEAALVRLRPDLAAPGPREAAVAEWWRNRVRTMAEFARIDELGGPARLLHENPQDFEAVMATGRPVIVLGLHLSSWEASFRMLLREADHGRRQWVGVWEPQPNRFENRIVHHLRRRAGVYAFPPGTRTAKRLLQLLKSGEANLALLIDEPSEGDVRFPLFGRRLYPRCNLRIAMGLARRTGALILPGYVLRTRRARFRGGWLPALDVADFPPGEAGEQALAAELSRHYEKLVLEHVTQWYMLDRLKFREEGAEAPARAPEADAGSGPVASDEKRIA